MKTSNPAHSAPAWLAALALVLLIGRAANTLPGQPAAERGLGVAAQGDNSSNDLVSYHSDIPPALDGQVDDVWLRAPVLTITMTHGLGSADYARDMVMRSLYTDAAVYFMAQWTGDPSPPEANAIFNMLTVHWTIAPVSNGLEPLSCSVACHTGYANSAGRMVSASTVTIPQGGRWTLAAGGGWSDGAWTMVWSRPLVDANPYDVQFSDLSQAYSFFVKVFDRVDGHADPISQAHLLVFQP